MSKVYIGWLFRAASVIFLLLAIAATYFALIEAYGSGSPYYGRTQNMDKWNDPIPILTAIDVLFVSAAFLLWRTGTRFLRSSNDA